MKLHINGQAKDIPVQTLVELLAHFEQDKTKVVIELNKEIVDKKDIDHTMLKEGDSIEIVTLVGGG